MSKNSTNSIAMNQQPAQIEPFYTSYVGIECIKSASLQIGGVDVCTQKPNGDKMEVVYENKYFKPIQDHVPQNKHN